MVAFAKMFPGRHSETFRRERPHRRFGPLLLRKGIPPPFVHYLNFNVDRLKSARISAAIQNRMMIFDSLHPVSSK